MTFERCEGAIVFFYFYFLFRNNGIREQLYQNDFCCCYGELFFQKCRSASTWSQLCSKFFLNSYKTPWQMAPWHMKDTLQLKILPTWINLSVDPAPRQLTYCSMLLFLSKKPIFCYWNNFCRNLLTFLFLKDVPPPPPHPPLPPPLINFSVFQPGHSYSNPPLPFIFHKTLVLVNSKNYWR